MLSEASGPKRRIDTGTGNSACRSNGHSRLCPTASATRSCGERVGVHIPHLEDLVATVAIARILHPIQLDGAEVKFIRRVPGRSAKEFAGVLEIAPETYSRWENGKQAVGAWADKQVRLAAIVVLRDKVARVHADPDAVVNMRIMNRGPADIPQMEVRLVRGDA